jgi:hypothetical protein
MPTNTLEVLIITAVFLVFVYGVSFLSIYFPAKFLSERHISKLRVLGIVIILYSASYFVEFMGYELNLISLKVYNFVLVSLLSGVILKLSVLNSMIVGISNSIFTLLTGFATPYLISFYTST